MGNILPYMMSIGPWSWLIIGCILLGLEVLLPGTFMLWFGVAAVVTGVLSLIFPLGIQSQIIIFALASVLSVLVGRKLYATDRASANKSLLHKRGTQLIGHSYKVIKPIVNGRGKVKVGDSEWIVTGDDAEIGAVVKVIAVNGNSLSVKRD